MFGCPRARRRRPLRYRQRRESAGAERREVRRSLVLLGDSCELQMRIPSRRLRRGTPPAHASCNPAATKRKMSCPPVVRVPISTIARYIRSEILAASPLVVVEAKLRSTAGAVLEGGDPASIA